MNINGFGSSHYEANCSGLSSSDKYLNKGDGHSTSCQAPCSDCAVASDPDALKEGRGIPT